MTVYQEMYNVIKPRLPLQNDSNLCCLVMSFLIPPRQLNI